MGSAISLLVDLCLAVSVCVGFVVMLPLLTLGGDLLAPRLGLGGGAKEVAVSDVGSREKTASSTVDFGDLVLFLVKGMAVWVLLEQGSFYVGGPIAAWAAAQLLERWARKRDRSMVLLIEPALGPLDYAFLVAIAPLLCAPVAGTAGISAGWHAYICTAYFWRSRASAAVAVALSIVCQYLSSVLGVFTWRTWVQGLGLTPAPELSLFEVAPLIPGAAVLLALDPNTRMSVVALACAYSTYTRARGGEIAISTLELLARVLPSFEALPPSTAS